MPLVGAGECCSSCHAGCAWLALQITMVLLYCLVLEHAIGTCCNWLNLGWCWNMPYMAVIFAMLEHAIGSCYMLGINLGCCYIGLCWKVPLFGAGKCHLLEVGFRV